jgi:DNA-binding PadR family transcriptional regulator
MKASKNITFSETNFQNQSIQIGILINITCMKGTHLGEFEEIVLLSVAILAEDAYGNSIKDEIRKRMGRNPSIGALHASLQRLEEKGYLESAEGETTPERGGRRKRYYKVTKTGAKAMQQVKDLRDSMWKAVPNVIIDLGKR